MPPDDEVAGRLWDMLTYAQEIEQTLRGVGFDRFRSDKNLRLATERRLEIIGEAARNVPRDFQDAHPEIPWQKIVAQRHVLSHEYGDIKEEMIFRVGTVHIPDLIQKIRSLIPPTPPQ